MSAYDDWVTARASYAENLKNGVGHRKSIIAIIEKIDKHLVELAKENKNGSSSNASGH